LKSFVDQLAEELGIVASIGQGQKVSLNLKSPDEAYNLGSIQQNGELWFYGIVPKTEELGNRQIGIDYLKELARLVGGELDDKPKPWSWGIKRNGKYLMVDEYLASRDQWKQLMERTLEQIQRASEEKE